MIEEMRLRDLGVVGVSARTFHSAALRQLGYFWPLTIGGAAPRVVQNKAQLVADAARRVGVPVDRARRGSVDRPVLEIPVDFVPFSQYLDIRPINAARPFGGGTDPTFEVWIRLRPDVLLPPAVRAAVLLDALPPGLFATRTAPVPIPTAEFTAHLAPAAHDPDGDWFHLRQHTTWASVDLCVDDTELRRPTGELVAQGRQLRRIMGG